MNTIKDLQEYLKSMSVSQASKKLGVSRQTIYNWLKGKHAINLKSYIEILRK